MSTNTETTQKTMLLTRTLNAPRELVWKAWTESKLMAEWWSPRGFTNPTCEIDVRPGGAIRIHMDHPNFPNHWMTGTFKEVSKPEKLVFISKAFEDENGNAELEILNTVTFEEINGKTKLTVNAQILKATEKVKFAVGGMNQGWNESIDKLEELLAKIK
jgi:uncharacterized protein YndB with AHSA1/START domain